MNLARHLGRFSWAVAARALPVVNLAALVFVVMPLLSVSEFGRYSIILNLFLLITLLTKSLILNPMIKFAAAPGGFVPFGRAGFWLGLLIYGMAGWLLWLAAPALAPMLRVSSSDVRLAAGLVWAFFPRDYGFCIRQTLYDMRGLFRIEAAYFLGSAGLLVFAGLTGRLMNAADAAWLTLFAAAGSSMIAIIFGFKGVALRKVPGRKEAATLVKYGYITVAIGIAAAVINGADVILLAGFYTPEQVGYYNGAKQFYRLLAIFAQAGSLMVMPYAARLQAMLDSAELQALFEKVIGYSILGITVAALGMVLAAGAMMERLFGLKYVGSVPILTLLVVAAPFDGLWTLGGNILYGIGGAGRLAAVSFAGAGVWLVASTVGLHLGGVMGATAGLVIAMAFSGIATFLITSRRVGSSVGKVLHRLAVGIRGAWGVDSA